MARQFRVDNIIDNNDGTLSFEIGPWTFVKDKSWFFDRDSFNSNHMIKNLRLSHKIGIKADIASREFRDSVNATSKGMDLGDRTWFIRNISLVPGTEEDYQVDFSKTRTGTVSESIVVSRSDIEQDSTENPEDIFDNIKSFLRVGNFTDFTSSAINQIKARLFWA